MIHIGNHGTYIASFTQYFCEREVILFQRLPTAKWEGVLSCKESRPRRYRGKSLRIYLLK